MPLDTLTPLVTEALQVTADRVLNTRGRRGAERQTGSRVTHPTLFHLPATTLWHALPCFSVPQRIRRLSGGIPNRTEILKFSHTPAVLSVESGYNVGGVGCGKQWRGFEVPAGTGQLKVPTDPAKPANSETDARRRMQPSLHRLPEHMDPAAVQVPGRTFRGSSEAPVDPTVSSGSALTSPWAASRGRSPP
jgi:hypothetical protein